MDNSQLIEIYRSMNPRIVFGSEIAKNKKLTELSDAAQILFLRAVCCFAGRGRFIGDPQMLLSIIHPRAVSKFAAIMNEIIQEWVDAELVKIFPPEGKEYDQSLQFIDTVGDYYELHFN